MLAAWLARDPELARLCDFVLCDAVYRDYHRALLADRPGADPRVVSGLLAYVFFAVSTRALGAADAAPVAAEDFDK